MTKELNHRELYVYENQDKLGLKEMAVELGLGTNVNVVHKMLKRANKFLGRTEPKKRASLLIPSNP